MTEAINLDPEYSPAYRNRGYAYESLRETELAEKDRQTLKELTVSSE